MVAIAVALAAGVTGAAGAAAIRSDRSDDDVPRLIDRADSPDFPNAEAYDDRGFAVDTPCRDAWYTAHRITLWEPHQARVHLQGGPVLGVWDVVGATLHHSNAPAVIRSRCARLGGLALAHVYDGHVLVFAGVRRTDLEDAFADFVDFAIDGADAYGASVQTS